MLPEEFANYFYLEAKLYNAVINYVRDLTKGTKDQSVPYKIKSIVNHCDNKILLQLYFMHENGPVQKDFFIKYKDLEKY